MRFCISENRETETRKIQERADRQKNKWRRGAGKGEESEEARALERGRVVNGAL